MANEPLQHGRTALWFWLGDSRKDSGKSTDPLLPSSNRAFILCTAIGRTRPRTDPRENQETVVYPSVPGTLPRKGFIHQVTWLGVEKMDSEAPSS